MSTTTGSNALAVPQSSDSPDVVRDITALANDVDPLLGPYVCTSTTRPASPTPGQRIVWETDTLRASYYNGTGWFPMTRPHKARVTNSTSTNLTTATYTKLPFDTEVNDADAMHDNVTNNTRLTIVQAGLYIVRGQIAIAANGTGTRLAQIWLNNATSGESVEVPANASVPTVIQVYGELQCAVGDYLELVAYQSSGATLTTFSGNQSTFFSARWVSE